MERILNAMWHGSQGVGDHVVGAFKDGELRAVTQQIVGHEDHCNLGARLYVTQALRRWGINFLPWLGIT
jgi:hypothetical protein